MMKLIATWLPTQEPDIEAPHSIIWEDGSTASMEDYNAHCGDTSFCVATDIGGWEWHIFPDITAEVFYCPHGRVWGLRGDGVVPTSLYITDPHATDSELQSALVSLLTWYRTKIVR
jgi:hypothetical protein